MLNTFVILTLIVFYSAQPCKDVVEDEDYTATIMLDTAPLEFGIEEFAW